MNELNRLLSDQVDFFYLDVDQSATRELMSQYDVRNRSTYVLLDANGIELARWVGPINLASMQAQIEQKLAE